MTVVILLLCAEFIAALGCGLAAGVFFAFSTFVMQGLKDLPTADGIKAMNAINNAAKKPSLMILLFGTALLCLVMMVAVLWLEGLPARADVDLVIGPIGGSVVYLVGAILVTLLRNVPLNNALAAANNADGPDDLEDLSARLGEVEPRADGGLHARLCAAHGGARDAAGVDHRVALAGPS